MKLGCREREVKGDSARDEEGAQLHTSTRLHVVMPSSIMHHVERSQTGGCHWERSSERRVKTARTQARSS